METGNDKIEAVVDQLYRSHFGRLVGLMLSRYRDLTLETVEDIVQDSFAAALQTWTREGLPERPAAWVYVVVRNRVINHLRSERKMWVADPSDAGEAEGDWGRGWEEDWERSTVVDDDQLRLLFTCAHPELSPKVQVVITLKYVVNLKMRAVAAALGMSEDTIEKLLFRARARLREKKFFLSEPGASALASRLPVVHKIIYLIFTEGYKPAAGDAMLKEELCGEALILAKSLLESRLGDNATEALYALMLFNAARLKARFDPNGALVDLGEQDRSLWSRPLITMGCEHLAKSRDEGRHEERDVARNAGWNGDVSSYHLEATIAWLHCTAKDFASTDWPLVSRLYGKLMERGANPWVELSYAIALYYAGDKERAFAILERLMQLPIMNQYYLLNVTLGKLYGAEGERYKSELFYRRALELTELPGELDFVRRQLGRLRAG
jgi:RNA polymerase sigma factor (sigma-70 family)